MTEQWIIRNTPLGWIKFYFYFSANKKSNSKNIPSYFYSSNLDEWLVYYLDGGKMAKCVQTQLIFSNKDGNIIGIVEDSKVNPEQEIQFLTDIVKGGRYEIDIRPTLPESFSSRLVFDSDKVLLIARTKIKADEVEIILKKQEFLPINKRRQHTGGPNQEFTHFKWSKINWAKFCAKIAFETLSLFEGAEYCLNSTFDQVRKFINEGPSKNYIEIIFDENGPIKEGDVPSPVYLDLTVGQNAPLNKKLFMGHCDFGMHMITIFEIAGWIYSSISIAGLPTSLLILGGPNLHLKDFYEMVYDEKDDLFEFYKLAYDPNLPIYPSQILGSMTEEIMKTYHLKTL